MRAPLLAAALLSSIGAFAADPPDGAPADPSAKTFKASFIGEGGGYKQADTTTEGYMVGDQNQQGNPDMPSAAPARDTSSDPSPKAAQRGGPQAAAAPRPSVPGSGASIPSGAPGGVPPSRSIFGRTEAADRAAPERAAAAPANARAAGRQSLWNGLIQPLGMTASQAAGAPDPDAARADSDRDYETHILGMKPGAARPALGAAPRPLAPAAEAAAGPAHPDGGKVFVSLEIDPREAGSLRDAVAGLGAAAGFTADSRFQAMAGPGGSVLFSGWISAGRLGAAMSTPGVKRLRVESRPRPSSPRETSGEFLVGLRVADPARARESVDAGVSALSAAAGFRLSRIVGLETAPDGRAVAVVTGFLPLSRLSKAMGLSEVAKIMPVGGEVPAPAPEAPASAKGGVSGFANFAMQRGPWLVIVTLLLLLPSLRAPLRRMAAVFNPYR